MFVVVAPDQLLCAGATDGSAVWASSVPGGVAGLLVGSGKALWSGVAPVFVATPGGAVFAYA